jgi:hypothetical protein
MLRNSLAFLLLISHVNFFMFIAQVDETDIYTANGNRINDINSVAEYIHDVILHHQNKPRPDEDDDNARYFHLVKTANYCFSQQVIIESDPGPGRDKNTFPHISTTKLLPVFYDVVTPPPKTVA